MTEQERAKASEEAYRKLRQELDDRLKADSRLSQIAEKIKAGRAGFQDTAEYSEIVSKHLSEVIRKNIGNIGSPLGLQYVCEDLLKDHYESINDVLGEVQTALDEKIGIHIKPQKAAFPAERVQQVAHSLVDPTVPVETISRRAGAPVENVAKSMHDDYMKENARFRSDAGLECYIVRSTDGKCCPWCTSMAGRYVYGEEPPDVYRRHDNCGCTVIYENGRTRQHVWSKKSWSKEEERAYLKELDAKKKAKRLSLEQGREIEQRNLSRFRGLTSGDGSDIMEARGVTKLEQAKKRDHKIEITDTAIEKVGRVMLSDFSEEQVAVMQAKHKDLLKIAKEKNNSNEVLLIDDLSFQSEVQIMGSEFAVSPGKNPFAVSVIANAKRQSLIYLHNHPSTNVFSIADIDTFICEGAIKAMSVVTNQGKVYILNKTKAYEYDKARRLMADVLASFDDDAIDNDTFVRRFLKKCSEGGIEYAKS